MKKECETLAQGCLACNEKTRQTILPGGDHSFTRRADYLDEILVFAGLV